MKINETQRSLLFAGEDWCDSAGGQIIEVIEKTLDWIGGLLASGVLDDTEYDLFSKGEKTAVELIEMYLRMRVCNIDQVSDVIVRNIVDDLASSIGIEKTIGDSVRYAAIGMEYALMAKLDDQKIEREVK